MERLAIISDIHGNLTALQAVLGDVEKRGIKRIICLGDLAGKGPSSVEVVDLIRERCEMVVKGNWDYFMTTVEDSEAITWHRARLGEEREAYLKQLPLYFEFYMSGKLVRLCHASPNDVFHRVHLPTPNEKRLKLFEPTPTSDLEADVVGYGDIHGAHVDHIGEKIIFNVGSVGNPLDFTWAAYAIMEGVFDSRDIDALSISIVRVPYDIEMAIREAEDISMPEFEDYAKELRTAIYRGRK